MKLIGKSHVAVADGTHWPRAAGRSNDIEWKLRNAPLAMTREDELVAASILSAYRYLVLEAGTKKRALVVRDLMAAEATPHKSVANLPNDSERNER